MKNPRPGEEDIIKDIKSPRIHGDINILSEHEEEKNYYKPERVINFWSNIYIIYKEQ